jgi:hypothetical protein
MHLVGARFATMEAALAALRDIRGTLPVEPSDVGLRPLGTTRYDEPTRDLVVAGRFEPAEVERVVGIMEGHGGSILVRRQELRRPGWPHTASTPVVVPPSRVDRPGEGRAGRAAEPARAGAAQRGQGQSRDGQSRHAHSRKRPRRPATHLHARATRERRIDR